MEPGNHRNLEVKRLHGSKVHMIRTKRVYDSPAPDDGYRLLVMRLWPRGMRKDAVDAWEPDLGPSRELLSAFRGGRIDWESMARRYVDEMAGRKELVERYRELARSRTVTLLCSCKDESHCHRTLLRGLLEQS
jgi:uncharacterized protein YeaO (DUF488 family)